MSEKVKILVVAGGTGGHVFPGSNLATHLSEKKYNVELATDKRGYKFLKSFNYLNILILPSSPLIKKNIFKMFTSIFKIFYSILRSLVFLIFNRPSIIFGMGGYASLPICIAASILRIKFVIYENNSIIGKANKLLLPFAKLILVSFKEIEGIPKKYNNKMIQVGNIIKKEIINFTKKNNGNTNLKKINLLVLGGSQAAKVFAEILPNIFKKCSDEGVTLNIFQHCLPDQNKNLNSFYSSKKIKFEIFNFSNNLIEFFSKTDLAITRSGSSMLAELTNANIPFISVPLPSSADNHQFKNAEYYQKKKMSFLIEEKNLNENLFLLLKDIYGNSSILDQMSLNQSQYSDKNVYKNIDEILKNLINEKN